MLQALWIESMQQMNVELKVCQKCFIDATLQSLALKIEYFMNSFLFFLYKSKANSKQSSSMNKQLLPGAAIKKVLCFSMRILW